MSSHHSGFPMPKLGQGAPGPMLRVLEQISATNRREQVTMCWLWDPSLNIQLFTCYDCMGEGYLTPKEVLPWIEKVRTHKNSESFPIIWPFETLLRVLHVSIFCGWLRFLVWHYDTMIPGPRPTSTKWFESCWKCTNQKFATISSYQMGDIDPNTPGMKNPLNADLPKSRGPCPVLKFFWQIHDLRAKVTWSRTSRHPKIRQPGMKKNHFSAKQ